MDQVEGNNSRGKRRIGRIDAMPGSHYDNYEVYLGKFNHPFLAVVNQSDPEWKILINDPNTINGEVVFDDNIDNGYREDEDQKGDFKFGSFDFNPADPKAHPDVYGCWGLGTFVAKWVDDGNGYSSDRKYEQMFTTLAATVNDNGFQQKFYESRGHLDEVFFDGSNVVFHPENSDIIMIGAPDNGVLRSIDGGQTWSSRKPRGQTAWENDYGTEVQKVYHIAFHSIKNNGEYKCVFASAGVLNNKRNNAGQGGELLINDDAGAGGSDRWSTMAGGPGEKNDLPNGEIHSFVFDPKPGWKKGLYVAVRGEGIYYGWINSGGNPSYIGTTGKKFVQLKIDDEQANPLIPPTSGNHHFYSSLQFDPDDEDVLYVARHWPAGELPFCNAP